MNAQASCPFNAPRLDCPVKARQLLDYHPEIVPSVAVEKVDKRWGYAKVKILVPCKSLFFLKTRGTLDLDAQNRAMNTSKRTQLVVNGHQLKVQKI